MINDLKFSTMCTAQMTGLLLLRRKELDSSGFLLEDAVRALLRTYSVMQTFKNCHNLYISPGGP